MKHLRQYIRRVLLAEAMVSPSSLTDDWAVWTSWYDDAEYSSGTELNFVLYNKVKALEAIANITASLGPETDVYTVVEAVADNTVAVIRARVPDAGYGECNKAWEIIRSAAEKGYGPTLYDLVMSVSPHGLTSDRSEVSGDARKVWSRYANNRSNVDKLLLDPEGNYTTTEEDDCTVQGNGSAWERSPLPALHRQMAIDFFEDWYAEEYGDWLEQQDPRRLEDLRHMDGNEYWEEVTQWIEKMAEDYEYEEWDMDDASDAWYQWKMENEPNLIDNVDGEINDTHALNISYNTSYASDNMSDLVGNHYNFASELEEDYRELDDEHLGFAVRDFFKEKY